MSSGNRKRLQKTHLFLQRRAFLLFQRSNTFSKLLRPPGTLNNDCGLLFNLFAFLLQKSAVMLSGDIPAPVRRHDNAGLVPPLLVVFGIFVAHSCQHASGVLLHDYRRLDLQFSVVPLVEFMQLLPPSVVSPRILNLVGFGRGDFSVELFLDASELGPRDPSTPCGLHHESGRIVLDLDASSRQPFTFLAENFVGF